MWAKFGAQRGGSVGLGVFPSLLAQCESRAETLFNSLNPRLTLILRGEHLHLLFTPHPPIRPTA